jgi:hypothetical protein
MASPVVPRQGDHVFNAIATALMHPFDTIASFRSVLVDGRHFVHDYLLRCYSFAKDIAESRIVEESRKHSASAGAEEEALRELAKLRGRYPALARINAAQLREIHSANATEFGGAAQRFEAELLGSLLLVLESVAAAPPAGQRAPSPGIAYQQMLSSAYDPAAALVVVTNSASRETAAHQGAYHPTIAAIAETLDRPGRWREPYDAFHEQRPTATGTIIGDIRSSLLGLDGLKGRSILFADLIRDEITHKSGGSHAQTVYGAMLHLLHQWQQQRRP